MYTYENLVDTDIQTLHRTFLDAFSDYQVNIQLSLEAFQTMLKKRGYTPESSIGAFKEPGHELVGFILNGLRDWQGKLTAYDLGTGITPPNRRQGLTRNMFRVVLEALTQKNVGQYLLEVLQENTAAFELYKKQGFSITRNYACFELDKSSYIPKTLSYNVECVTEIKWSEWEQLKLFWEFTPSWQNSIDSVRAAQEVFGYAIVRLDNNIVGYGIIDKKTGDVPQIAVHKAYRCKGIATSIVAALLNSTDADVLRVINVDETNEEMKLFLSKCGFEQTVCQYEMMLITV